MGGRSKFIVVDGDTRHLDAVCALLKDEGYEVDGFSNALKALEAIQHHPYDLLLSDIQMQQVDGVTLARGAMLARPQLATILMAAHASFDAPTQAGHPGVAFIRKPFVMSELQPVVARALEVHHLRLENARLLKVSEEANAQLESVTTELNALAGRVSHDMQAVMQVVAGFASALQRELGARLEAKQAHYLQRVIDTSDRGSRLVQELVAYSRLGARPLECRPVDMADIFRLARTSLEPECQGRQIEWVVGDLPLVQGDPVLLEQAMVHLLSNALKFSRARPVARISIECHPCDPGVELAVRDNGVGFDSSLAERLFQPFERLHSAEEFKGNGMGLANVRKIVHAHGGSVRAESAAEGALFAFTLPKVASRAPVAAAAPSDGSGEKASTVARPRVLVIDDDPVVLISLRNMLELDAAHVTVAAGGQIGVDAFAQALEAGTPHDVVVTDFAMPQMDGSEVARRIKEMRPATTVVLLSGWGSGLQMRPEWRPWVDALLGKPPRLAELRRAVAQWQPER